MRFTRYHRWLTALLALSSMLFMQLAVSAYACPTQIASVVALAHEHMSMPDCAGMDQQQPVLCAAYAHPNQPSLDKPDLPTVSQFIPSALSATIIPFAPVVHDAGPLPGDRLLTRSTAPPLAIQHCRFLN